MATSVVDAVDGSSTGTRVPWMWALLRLPRFRGATYADDHDNRSRHRQVAFVHDLSPDNPYLGPILRFGEFSPPGEALMKRKPEWIEKTIKEIDQVLDSIQLDLN